MFMGYMKVKSMSSSTLYQQLNNEFHQGYIYLSQANESNNYLELAKNQIENGMKIFNNISNQNLHSEF